MSLSSPALQGCSPGPASCLCVQTGEGSSAWTLTLPFCSSCRTKVLSCSSWMQRPSGNWGEQKLGCQCLTGSTASSLPTEELLGTSWDSGLSQPQKELLLLSPPAFPSPLGCRSCFFPTTASCIPNKTQPRKAEAPLLPQPTALSTFFYYLARPAIAAVHKGCQGEVCKGENGN